MVSCSTLRTYTQLESADILRNDAQTFLSLELVFSALYCIMVVIKSLLASSLALWMILVAAVPAYPFLPSQSSLADLLNRATQSATNLTPSVTNAPALERDPSEILAQAREAGHIVNLLEYTKALERKYGKTQSWQTQSGSAASHHIENLNAREAQQKDAGKDADLSSSLSFSTAQAKVYEVGNHM